MQTLRKPGGDLRTRNNLSDRRDRDWQTLLKQNPVNENAAFLMPGFPEREEHMIKVIMVVKKKQGISREEFYKYWKNEHGPLVAKHIPHMKKYIQNHFIEIPGNEYEGDGIIETWYDDIESFQKSMQFNQTARARDLDLGEDWAKIADMSEAPKMWVVEEHVIKDDLQKEQ